MAIDRLMRLLAPRDGKAPLTSSKYLSLKGEDTFVAKKDGNRFLAWFRKRDEKNKAAVEFVKHEIDGELGPGVGDTILRALGIDDRMTGQDMEKVKERADEFAAAQKAKRLKRLEKAGDQWRHPPGKLLSPLPPPIRPLPPITHEFSNVDRAAFVEEWNARPRQAEGESALVPRVTVVGRIKNEIFDNAGKALPQYINELTGYNSDVSDRLFTMLTESFMDHLEHYLPDQAKAASYQLQRGFSICEFNITKEANNQYRVQLNLVQQIEGAFDKAMDPFKSFRELNAEFLVHGKGLSIEKGPEVAIRLQPA